MKVEVTAFSACSGKQVVLGKGCTWMQCHGSGFICENGAKFILTVAKMASQMWREAGTVSPRPSDSLSQRYVGDLFVLGTLCAIWVISLDFV